MDIVLKLMVKPAMDIRKLATLLAVVFALFILYSLARITWHLLTPTVEFQPWQPPNVSSAKQQAQLTDFSNYHWFGKAGEQPKVAPKPQQVSDAPKTRLKLVLTGVVANDDPSQSMAIIEYQSNQDTYVIDQKISSTRASVVEIHADRVILNNSGKHETLMLDGFDYTKRVIIQQPVNQSASPRQPASSKINKRQLQKTRRDIIADPTKITDHISITPVKPNGVITGYRLNAGRDPELFRQSGLKANDLAVSINGYDLRDMAQAIQVMGELKTLNNIMITVERGGQLHDIQFALAE